MFSSLPVKSRVCDHDRQIGREVVNMKVRRGERQGSESDHRLLTEEQAVLALSSLSSENRAPWFSFELTKTLMIASVVGAMLWLELWTGSCLTNVLSFQSFPVCGAEEYHY